MRFDLAHFTADGMGPRLTIPGGTFTVWFGAAGIDGVGHYDFGGGQVALEIADDGVGWLGFRPLRILGEPVVFGELAAINITVAPCVLLARMTGSTNPDLQVFLSRVR